MLTTMKCLPILLLLFVACISCAKGSAASDDASVNNLQDSIIETHDESPLEFLGRLGIDAASLVANDTFPLSHNDSVLALNERQMRQLLDFVATVKYDISDIADLSTGASINLVDALNENFVVCLYDVLHHRLSKKYLATYDNAGRVIDAVLLGIGPTYFEEEKTLSDGNKIKSIVNNNTVFNSKNELTQSYKYEEVGHDVNANSNNASYIHSVTMTYAIDSIGRIEVMNVDSFETGSPQKWNWSDPKEREMIYEMEILTQYPISDKKSLDMWNDLSKCTDGYVSELFSDKFFIYVFLSNPEKVLNWIYQHRDDSPQLLSLAIEFNYITSPELSKIVDSIIDRLDDESMRSYFKARSQSWSSDY